MVVTINSLHISGVCHREASISKLAAWSLAAILCACTAICNAQTVLQTVSGVTGAYGVAINPVTHQVYVTNSGNSGSDISVFDGVMRAPPVQQVGGSAAGARVAAVNPATNRIYVANFGTGTVSIIDGSN